MAFATSTDVETRLGRELTSIEEDQVELLLDLATAAIGNAADLSDAEASALSPVPTVIRGFCIELTCRALANPNGLFSRSETIGSYSYSENFNRDVSSAMSLSDVEVLVIRRTLLGSNAGSARASNVLDELCEELDCHEGS